MQIQTFLVEFEENFINAYFLDKIASEKSLSYSRFIRV